MPSLGPAEAPPAARSAARMVRILPQSLPLQSAHLKHQVYVLLRHPFFEQVIKRHPRPHQKSAPDVASHLDFFRLALTRGGDRIRLGTASAEGAPPATIGPGLRAAVRI